MKHSVALSGSYFIFSKYSSQDIKIAEVHDGKTKKERDGFEVNAMINDAIRNGTRILPHDSVTAIDSSSIRSDEIGCARR